MLSKVQKIRGRPCSRYCQFQQITPCDVTAPLPENAMLSGARFADA